MKMYGAVSLAVLAIISYFPYTGCAVLTGIPERLAEDPQNFFVNQFRERRSPQFSLSGGGSGKAGTVRLDGQRNVFNNGRTGVDATGFAQRSWQKGFPSQNSFGAGAEVTHNLYKGRNGQSLDAVAGYQRQWNTGSKHNANVGLRYNF